MSLPHSTQVTTKTVTPFKLDDLNGIDWLPDGAYMDLSSILARSTIWTGRVNGHVVAICGLTKLNGHTAEAWTEQTAVNTDLHQPNARGTHGTWLTVPR